MVSVNQVRQLFVVNGTDTTVVGGIAVKETHDKKHVFVEYNGKGGLVRSDLIKKDNVISAKLTTADKMAKPLKEAILTLNPNINEGNPIVEQNYIVDVLVSNYITMADASTLVKFGAVHVTPNMSASTFYVELAKSLARNFSRDINKFFSIVLSNGTKEEEVKSPYEVKMADATSVIIRELPQTKDYVRGEFPVTTVNFQVIPKTVIGDGSEVNPFMVDENSGLVEILEQEGANSYIGNGYELADTEYFCMGERGDWYRGVGYPNTIRTKYMVEEDKEYDVIDINFYFEGRGISAQKSEKMLTLVVPKGNTTIKALFTGKITIE